ncbi:hypothetical protein KVR01_004219 [Diaporthe batatas]|uniref:uncharacterized protein n=1 Tax=Diaporthe batatas TaxID=748121 RepID=UPI001D044D01|nr:uncharacterized protein KVR01_004219 [Diaporthe batatas]KAG8165667.1 hypothetical protein KVR01_004219 [Diaporthe batatas]
MDTDEALDRRRKQKRLAQRRFRQRNGRQKATPELQYFSPGYADSHDANGPDVVVATPSDWLPTTSAEPSASSLMPHNLSITTADDLIPAFEVDVSALTARPDEQKAPSFCQFGFSGNVVLDDIITLNMGTGDRRRDNTPNDSSSAREKGKGNDNDENWQSPLNIAAQAGHKRIVIMLLQRNDVDCEEGDGEGLVSYGLNYPG